jgi:hypothetical protein
MLTFGRSIFTGPPKCQEAFSKAALYLSQSQRFKFSEPKQPNRITLIQNDNECTMEVLGSKSYEYTALVGLMTILSMNELKDSILISSDTLNQKDLNTISTQLDSANLEMPQYQLNELA